MATPLFKTGLWTLLLALGCVAGESDAAGGVVVIGNANLTRLDSATLERIYTGRTIEVDGVHVTVVNANSGTAVRTRFLQVFLNQNEDKYTGYWTVRRYNGLGAPPRELPPSEVIDFVKSTPGAIGYIDEADIPAGVNVLLK